MKEDFKNHIGGFSKLVHAQSWEIALMPTLEMKVVLPQIWDVCCTLVNMNEGYYLIKVERQEFHLHIAQVLDVPNNGDKTYFGNVCVEHPLSKFLSRDESL